MMWDPSGGIHRIIVSDFVLRVAQIPVQSEPIIFGTYCVFTKEIWAGGDSRVHLLGSLRLQAFALLFGFPEERSHREAALGGSIARSQIRSRVLAESGIGYGDSPAPLNRLSNGDAERTTIVW
jgi:hypothetical protein